MDLKARFQTNKESEINGVWVDIGGAKIKVARTGNRKYGDRLTTLMKPHRHAMRTETMSNEVADGILIRVIAETILLDWDGIEIDGATLPYSIDNAIKVLTELPDFRKIVEELAKEMETFRDSEIKDASGN